MRPCIGLVCSCRSIGVLIVAVLMLNILGCGGGAVSDKFKGERGSVSGKITYKGAPVPAGSSVVFQSKEGGYSAGGTTNLQGEYSLRYDGKTVMPAVTYLVGVSPPPPPQPKADPSKMSAPVDDSPKTEAPPAFPSKYFIATGSGLEFTVKGGANKADFDLKDE